MIHTDKVFAREIILMHCQIFGLNATTNFENESNVKRRWKESRNKFRRNPRNLEVSINRT